MPGRLFPVVMLCALSGAAYAQEPAKPELPPPATPQTPPTTPGQTPQDGLNLDAPSATPRPQQPDSLFTRPGQPGKTAGEERQEIPQAQRDRVYLDHADRVVRKENTGIIILTGNIRIRYNNYTITCQRATFDTRRRVLTFESSVEMSVGDQVVYADFVTVDVKTNEFLTRDGRTVVGPDRIGQQIVQPVRISGSTLSRTGRNFQATNGFLTTCDFPKPHYKIGFRQADIIPNDRLVLRDAVFYRYEKPVFRIRYLVVPIREGRQLSYIPYIGRTNEEGWFLKVVLGYSLSKTLPGLLKIDLMEKKGIGLGFDQAYQFGDQAAGTVAFYNLNDKGRGVNNTNGRINHQQRFGEVLATIATDFQNNSYQSLNPTSKTGTTTVTLARTAQQRDTNVSLSQNRSDYGTSNSVTTAYTITQTERLGESGSIVFRFNSSDATNNNIFEGVTSTSGREEQSGDLKASGKVGIFDADIAANRTFLARQKGTAGGAAFSGTQRLPDITLGTDSERLGALNGIFKRLPSRFQVGYGRYLENVTDFSSGALVNRAVTTNRLLFNADLNPRPRELKPRGWMTLSASGSFKQTYYRSDAQQYVLTGRGALLHKLGKDSSLSLNYNYLRPYGGTPEDFRLDTTGSSNNLSSTFSVDSYRTRISLIAGYDIQRAWTDTSPGIRRNPWQNMALQLALRPSDVLQTRFTASYDINSGKLLDLTNKMRIRGRNRFALDTGMRYDPLRKKISQVTEVATIPLFSRDLTLTALTGYNGLTYKFDYQQFTLTQSFHDYQLVFGFTDQPYGIRRERGINFTIRLKALPFLQPTTGNQYGTPLDTGTGEVF